MKRVLIFIGLKLIEIVGAVIAFALFMLLMYFISINNIVKYVTIGIMVIIISPFLFVVGQELIMSNWDRAGRMAKKKR